VDDVICRRKRRLSATEAATVGSVGAIATSTARGSAATAAAALPPYKKRTG